MRVRKAILSDLLQGDGFLLTDFHTGFTPKTLINIHGYGLFILKLKHLHRTDIDTFAAPDA
jgi:hypothetical protein